MRFTTAWAQTTSQNIVLRLVLVLVTTCLGIMSFITAKLALRNPIVIERACFSSVVEPKSSAPTNIEVEAFINEVVQGRFNTETTPNSEMMTLDEVKLRAKEQDELMRRQIKQRIVINSINRSQDTVVIDADRLISVGTIRSVLPFPLSVTLSSVKRTQANPYGLVATKIVPVQSPDTKSETK